MSQFSAKAFQKWAAGQIEICQREADEWREMAKRSRSQAEEYEARAEGMAARQAGYEFELAEYLNYRRQADTDG